MLALGVVVQGLALAAVWPVDSIAIVVGAILLLTFGEMLLAPICSALAVSLAPRHLRGSYEGVVNVAYASMWSPGVLAGLWLVGIGRGELMLGLCLPLALIGAACFLPLPRSPVPVDETQPVKLVAQTGPAVPGASTARSGVDDDQASGRRGGATATGAADSNSEGWLAAVGGAARRPVVFLPPRFRFAESEGAGRGSFQPFWCAMRSPCLMTSRSTRLASGLRRSPR